MTDVRGPEREADGPALVLASASGARRRMLSAAGLFFETLPAAVDEEEVKITLRREGATAMQVAETLAELKACRISAKREGALVIGADQMLDCEGDWYAKPGSLDQARDHLRSLSGRVHRLETAVCVVRDGSRIWHHNTQVRMTVRPLSESFVDWYLGEVGQAALDSVGGYQLEGLGVQLFARVEGDFFTVLGLPLLPLLDFLRQHKALPE